MTQVINQVIQFLQQGIAAIFRFLQLIWTWSFGQIVAIFQSDWQSLPLWKLALLIVVLGAIAYILYRVIMVLWEAAESVFKAFVGLLMAFVSVLPQIVIAGLIAFGGGWLINNVNL